MKKSCASSGYLQRLYRDARSTEHKIQQNILVKRYTAVTTAAIHCASSQVKAVAIVSLKIPSLLTLDNQRIICQDTVN